MAKKTLSKFTLRFVAMLLMMASVGFVATNARWTTIIATYNYLQLFSGGRLQINADTEVQRGYLAGVKVELQQNDGGWKTIKTWNSTEANYTEIYTDWYVVKNFQYRMKITHTAVTSDGYVQETYVNYSNTVSYY